MKKNISFLLNFSIFLSAANLMAMDKAPWRHTIQINHTLEVRTAADVSRMHKNGFDINAKNTKGLTVLQQAATFGDLAVADQLVKYGANLEASDDNGLTALHYATMNGHVDIVKLLIENKANIEAETKIHNKALHLAAYRGHIAIVKQLIAAGALLCSKGEGGHSPLKLAISRGNLKTAKLLSAVMTYLRYNVLVDKIEDVEIGIEIGSAMREAECQGREYPTSQIAEHTEIIELIKTLNKPLPSAPMPKMSGEKIVSGVSRARYSDNEICNECLLKLENVAEAYHHLINDHGAQILGLFQKGSDWRVKYRTPQSRL